MSIKFIKTFYVVHHLTLVGNIHKFGESYLFNCDICQDTRSAVQLRSMDYMTYDNLAIADKLDELNGVEL